MAKSIRTSAAAPALRRRRSWRRRWLLAGPLLILGGCGPEESVVIPDDPVPMPAGELPEATIEADPPPQP